MTKIGIVIPSYNQGTYIGRAINSIRKQEFADWELLVIDGESGDFSVLETEKAKCGDLRIKIMSVPYCEMNDKLNMGFDLLKTPYLTWLSADDYWKDNFLQEMAGILDVDGNIDLAYSAYDEVAENKHSSLDVKHVRGENIGTYQDFLHSNNIGIFWLFRASLWVKVGKFSKMIGEDHDWALRAYEAGAKFKLMPLSLANRWVHPDMTTKRLGEEGMEKARRAIIDAANKRGKGELCRK